MTKQEKIREGIAKYIRLHYKACEAASEITSDVILRYLHSQGVVIKVERELPYGVKKMCDLRLVNSVIETMLKAGYVAVEPLVI